MATELLIAILSGGLIAGLAAGFGVFYSFQGRLSRIEAQLELLMNALNNQALVPGIPVPVPSLGKPVGGSNAIVDTLQVPSLEIQQEEIATVFELITDGEALVNLVRAGQIAIRDIRLVASTKEKGSGGNGGEYAAIISMENLTDHALAFVVPKGQVFENREPRSGRQNLSAAREQKDRLLPRMSYELRVDALCMNRELSGPNGSQGNLTIFRIRNDKFEGQEELWQSVTDSVRQARLIVEGRRKKTR